jgi:uncharacterized DUF497 family protein
MKISGIDWDIFNLVKCLKHGLSIELIESFLLSAPHLIQDRRGNYHETRFVAVGRHKGKNLMVVFAIRLVGDKLMLRPISARRTGKSEILRRVYGKKKNKKN